MSNVMRVENYFAAHREVDCLKKRVDHLMFEVDW